MARPARTSFIERVLPCATCKMCIRDSSGCDDMADVARYYLEESGQLGELPAHLQNYIDYAAYGRDMELEGTFVVTNHGVYEIIR